MVGVERPGDLDQALPQFARHVEDGPSYHRRGLEIRGKGRRVRKIVIFIIGWPGLGCIDLFF